MVGVVGDDVFVKDVLVFFFEGGVDFFFIKIVVVLIGIVYIFVGGDGENVIVVVFGVNGEVLEVDVEKVVVVMDKGGYFMFQFEVLFVLVEKVLMFVKIKGVIMVINIVLLMVDVVWFLVFVDVVIFNEIEFELLIGRSGLFVDVCIVVMQVFLVKIGQMFIVMFGVDGVVVV